MEEGDGGCSGEGRAQAPDKHVCSHRGVQLGPGKRIGEGMRGEGKGTARSVRLSCRGGSVLGGWRGARQKRSHVRRPHLDGVDVRGVDGRLHAGRGRECRGRVWHGHRSATSATTARRSHVRPVWNKHLPTGTEAAPAPGPEPSGLAARGETALPAARRVRRRPGPGGQQNRQLTTWRARWLSA